ncbi:MAG: biopolymer transporter ExbD [Bdellovibrionota bacterium]
MAMKRKKTLDFEVNLIPFIDLLSTCICFLLLTAVWVQVGSINVKQAVGGQAAEETAKKPTVWVLLGATGDVTLDVRDAKVPAKLSKFTIAGLQGKPNLEQLMNAVQQLKAAEPRLTTALIQPQAASVYEDIINLMDQFKTAGLIDLGVAPL